MNCAHVVDGVVLLGTKNEQASQNPVSAKWRCGFKGFLFIGNVASWRDISKHKNYFTFSFSPLLIAFISVKKQRKRRVFFLLIYIYLIKNTVSNLNWPQSPYWDWLLSNINERVGSVSEQLMVDPVEVVQPPHLLLGQLAVVGEVVLHRVSIMTCYDHY